MNITEKKQKIQVILSNFQNIAVAYSGGIDSSLVLKLANDTNKKVKSFIVKTFFTSKEDFNDAINFCRKFNISFQIIEPDDSQFKSILNNPIDRCYQCKKIIFNNIINETKKSGYDIIIDGSNISDSGDYRPGKKALEELGIISPFIECDITKEDIRIIAKDEGIDFFNKPSNSCLITRIPYDKTITREKIDQIEKGEKFLIDHGFNVVRLRHFDNIALIEIGDDERKKLFDLKTLDKIKEYISGLGFDYVGIEAGGYKTGNLNKFLGRTINYG